MARVYPNRTSAKRFAYVSIYSWMYFYEVRKLLSVEILINHRDKERYVTKYRYWNVEKCSDEIMCETTCS